MSHIAGQCKIDTTIIEPASVEYGMTPYTTDSTILEQGLTSLRPIGPKFTTTWSFNYILGTELAAMLGASWTKFVNNLTYTFTITVPDPCSNTDMTFTGFFKEYKFKLYMDAIDFNERVYEGFSVTWEQY